MQTEKHPYEVLIRWDQTGTLAGAHVQHRFVIRDGAAVIGETLGQAEPLTLDTAAGFPLGDLLSQAQTDALTAKASADAQRDAAVIERNAAVDARKAAEQALAGAMSDLAAVREYTASLNAERTTAQAVASAAQAHAVELEARAKELEAQLATKPPAA